MTTNAEDRGGARPENSSGLNSRYGIFGILVVREGRPQRSGDKRKGALPKGLKQISRPPAKPTRRSPPRRAAREEKRGKLMNLEVRKRQARKLRICSLGYLKTGLARLAELPGELSDVRSWLCHGKAIGRLQPGGWGLVCAGGGGGGSLCSSGGQVKEGLRFKQEQEEKYKRGHDEAFARGEENLGKGSPSKEVRVGRGDSLLAKKSCC